MEFNQRLKELRTKAGLTQKKVAEDLGIVYQSYQKWELGKRNPNGKTLEQIANYFHVSIDSLVFGEDNTSSDINNKLEQLSSSSQKEIVDLINQRFEEEKIKKNK